MRIHNRRIALGATMTLIAMLLLPAAASATQSPNGCGQYGPVIYSSMPAPSSLRSIGKHKFEYLLTWDSLFGGPGSFSNSSSITFAAGTPLYSSDVLLRLFSNWGQLADGSVDFNVQVIDPTQPARFFVANYYNTGDTLFASTLVVSVRWQTSSGWSDWTVVPNGPSTSACAPGGVNQYGGLFKEAYGWAG
jgi:hypothetical protein